MTGGTLEQWGIPADHFTPAYPLPVDDEGNPRCIVIGRFDRWEEMQTILELNRKTHPADKLWIGLENGQHVLGREK